MTVYKFISMFFLLITVFGTLTTGAFAWFDKTHLAITKAAEYANWYNATGADQIKLKSKEESLNHYCNLPAGLKVDSSLVLKQKQLYNQANDRLGHLYGAILGALDDYHNTTIIGKYAEYHLAFVAHYIGDLSQPLHNVPYDKFNKENHKDFDGIVDDEVFENIMKIQNNMYPIDLGANPWKIGLPREIARVANLARDLSATVQKERRLITKKEAYRQLGHSASLLKAVIQALKR